jgi:hypothetical protein
MPGFSSYDNLISAITQSGQFTDFNFFKVSAADLAAGVWHSCWLDVGFPGAGATPGAAGSGTTYDGTSTHNNGGMGFAAVSPASRFGLSFGAVATQSLSLQLYDRLVATSGILTTSTGSKTATTVALPRYTSGLDVEAWLECTATCTGTVPAVHLLSYTGNVNGSGQVGGNITLPGLLKAGDMIQLPLASGDTGVTAVSTINVDTAGTVGTFNLVLLKPLATIPLTADVWNERDLIMQIAGLPQVFDTACLCLKWLATTTTAPNIWGQIRTAYE